jgi:PadR family transcriptional regulator
MAPQSLSLLQGTLDMLVLKALLWGPRHGYGVLRWIRQASGEELGLEEGALYPALHRLELKGWVEAEWGVSENNRQAKYYQLTPQGRAHLSQEHAAWERYVRAVGRVMDFAEEAAP